MGEAGRFSVLCWPDGSVVFDRSTGDTHAFDSFTYALFAFQQEGAPSDGPWLDAVPVKFPEMPKNEIQSRYELAMEQLQKLGFVKAQVN